MTLIGMREWQDIRYQVLELKKCLKMSEKCPAASA
jgi:hypothetical protein